MIKRVLSILLLSAVMLTCFSACGKKGGDLKVAMIANSTNGDDYSVNANVWSALDNSIKTELGLEVKRIVPKDMSKDTLLAAIKKLVGEGYNMIVLPGDVFAEPLQEAQILYHDCMFVALDFKPLTMGPTTVCLSFASHEAGFMAGFAAALKLDKGRVGAVLGEKGTASQLYSYGFQQGIKYANTNYGTAVTAAADDFIYSGTFDDLLLCQQLAATLYDRGVKCVFVAAGGAGLGALIEGKQRRANGIDIWAVGSDASQYANGRYDGANSVVITSALKRLGEAVIDMVELAQDGKFPGGKTVTYDAANGGVGMPSGEPNLSKEQRETCEKVYRELQEGDIKVSAEWVEGLIG